MFRPKISANTTALVRPSTSVIENSDGEVVSETTVYPEVISTDDVQENGTDGVMVDF